MFAVGDGHALRAPCRRLVDAVRSGRLEATTTSEVIQEFAHIRARRRGRADAAALARSYADLLAPLAVIEREDLERGLRLFEAHPELGAFDAVLAATTIGDDATALISADGDFAAIRALRHVAPGTPEFDSLIGSTEGSGTPPG